MLSNIDAVKNILKKVKRSCDILNDLWNCVSVEDIEKYSFHDKLQKFHGFFALQENLTTFHGLMLKYIAAHKSMIITPEDLQQKEKEC